MIQSFLLFLYIVILISNCLIAGYTRSISDNINERIDELSMIEYRLTEELEIIRINLQNYKENCHD